MNSSRIAEIRRLHGLYTSEGIEGHVTSNSFRDSAKGLPMECQIHCDEGSLEFLRHAHRVVGELLDFATEAADATKSQRGWVYVVLHEDRHADPEPYVFTFSDEAVEFARQLAEECVHDDEEIEEQEIEGRLYLARYSEEGDSVSVRAVEVNAEVDP